MNQVDYDLRTKGLIIFLFLLWEGERAVSAMKFDFETYMKYILVLGSVMYFLNPAYPNQNEYNGDLLWCFMWAFFLLQKMSCSLLAEILLTDTTHI